MRSFAVVVTALAVALLVASTPAFAASTSPKPEDSDAPEEVRLYNQGTEHLKKGNWDQAALKLRRALKVKEDFAEAHNNLGYALRKMGGEFHEAALEHYDRALELAPDLAEAHHYRGVLHVLMGDPNAAREDHAALEELNPKLADQLEAVIDGGPETAAEGDGGIAGTW